MTRAIARAIKEARAAGKRVERELRRRFPVGSRVFFYQSARQVEASIGEVVNHDYDGCTGYVRVRLVRDPAPHPGWERPWVRKIAVDQIVA